ncbi:unnamed protein product [Choristocarpus tenellus]
MACSCTMHPEVVVYSTPTATWLRSPAQPAVKSRVSYDKEMVFG